MLLAALAVAASYPLVNRSRDGGKLRVLYFRAKIESETEMDRWWDHSYEAARTHPSLEAYRWGPGWDGYAERKTLRQNIEARWGYVDILFFFDYSRTPKRFASEIREISDANLAVVVHRDAEARDMMNEPTIQRYRPHVLEFAYPYEMIPYYAKYGRDHLLACCPHAALPEVFYEPDLSRRRGIPLLVAGAMGEKYYPLRTRVADLVISGRLPGGVVRKHPGYEQRTPSIEDREAQIRAFAAELKDSKVIVIGTYRGYLLRKYVESAMAGTLIISEVPTQDQALWQQVVIPATMDMSDAEIVSTVKWWVTHDTDRRQHVAAAQRLVAARYSERAAVDLLLEGAALYKAGARGIYCPFSFSNPD